MTPAERTNRFDSLRRELSDLSHRLGRVSRNPDALARLESLHDMNTQVSDVRQGFADLKADAAAEAKEAHTHDAIAARLEVSKPYVQQMVYRGRT